MARRYCGVARSWREPHICRDDGREPHHGGRPHRSHQALACRLQLGPLELCSMVEDLRRRLCNDGHEDQFPLFRLSARYWLSDETFVGVHKGDDVGREAPIAVIGQTSLARLPTTLSGHEQPVQVIPEAEVHGGPSPAAWSRSAHPVVKYHGTDV